MQGKGKWDIGLSNFNFSTRVILQLLSFWLHASMAGDLYCLLTLVKCGRGIVPRKAVEQNNKIIAK